MKHNTTVRLALSAALLTGASFSDHLVPAAQAFGLGNIGSLVLNSALEYNAMNQYLSNIDGPGRDEYMGKLKAENGVYDGEQENQMLGDIMLRLTNTFSETEPSVVEKPFSYFVNSKESFNAFCAPGHNISVNKGAFPALNYNEDEMAFVVAHEMAHGIKKHSIKKQNNIIPLKLLKQAISYNSNTTVYSDKMAALVMNYTVAKGYTLPNEWEADNFSYDYTVQADYNPGAAAAVWQRMKDTEGDNHISFLGEVVSPNDHPTNTQRRDNFSKKLTEYSDNTVVVKDGLISVKGQDFLTPTAVLFVDETVPVQNGVAQVKTISAAERAYLIAGNIARAYKDPNKKKAAAQTNLTSKIVWDDEPVSQEAPKVAVADNGTVKVGKYEIVTPNIDEPSAEELATRLNTIYGVAGAAPADPFQDLSFMGV